MKNKISNSIAIPSDTGDHHESQHIQAECILVLSIDGCIQQASNASLDMIGANDNSEIIGFNFSTLLTPHSQNTFNHACSNLINGEEFDIHVEGKNLNNTFLCLQINICPVKNESGAVISLLCVCHDLISLRATTSQLKASKRRFQLLSEAIPQQVWTADSNGLLIHINHRAIEFFGMSRHVILGSGWPNLIHPDDLDAAIQRWSHSVATGKEYKIDFRLKRGDGEYRWHIAQALPARDERGKITEWFGTNTDIHDRKTVEHELSRIHTLLDESQHIAKVGGWELDVASGSLFWTEETYHLLDTSSDEFNPTLDAGVDAYLPESREKIQTALTKAIKYGKDYDLELKIHTQKGREIDVRTTGKATQVNGKTIKITGIFQDISQQKEFQRSLEEANRNLAHANGVLKHIAHYDPLTRLPNRTLLADRMQQAMKHNIRRGSSIAVAFLDLDGFKEVNDAYGHSHGDTLLIHVAERIKHVLRASDTLARIGGDEFVAVLSDLTSPNDCEPLLERMLAAVTDPIMLNAQPVQVSASIGVTIYPQDGVDAEQLLRHSDQAMYIAKQAGKNCYHIFDVAKDAEHKNHREELENIRRALLNNEFVLYYQPKVNMQSGKVIGVEALIRWQHPERGILAPGLFLPIIEDDYLIVTVGEWVLETALQQIQSWKQHGLNLSVSINISALQLQQPNFVKRLKSILEKFPDMNANDLELEILETSALCDISQVSKVINECQNIGINFSLDDFGTGYSSLAYLKRLPAKILKIDQSFVRDMLEDSDDLAIIQGIVGLASAFDRYVIAEGVETIAHGEKLLALGCMLAQGYGIARPMPAEEIPNWVKTWRPDKAWQKITTL